MIDMDQSKVRVRKWPDPRPGKGSLAQQANRQKFAMAQLASKYLSPQQMLDITQARAGTPLLPRDIVTSMLYGRLAMFEMPDGKRVYNVAARNDVSEALDTISQTEGDILIRGPEHWEARGAANPGGWSVIMDHTISTPITQLQSPMLNGLSQVFILAMLLTTSVSAQRCIRFSTDGGTSYMATTSDYGYLDAAGVGTGTTGLAPQSQSTSAARGFMVSIAGLDSPERATFYELNRARGGYTRQLTAPVNRLAILPLVGSTPTGTLTGGRVIMWGM